MKGRGCLLPLTFWLWLKGNLIPVQMKGGNPKDGTEAERLNVARWDRAA